MLVIFARMYIYLHTDKLANCAKNSEMELMELMNIMKIINKICKGK